MAHHCRKLTALAPYGRFLVHQHTAPVKHFWSRSRASDFATVIRDMNRTMERLEKEFLEKFSFQGTMPGTVPIQGVVPHSGTYQLNIDVNGFKPEEIKISLKDRILMIHAKMERTAEDGSKFHQEFTREVTVPENVDLAEVKSYLDNSGILRLEGPYKPSPEEAPKEIPVSKE
ncbi:hypothetical protein C0J52_13672 [Blattella germanica]|nr:hypothetical protein C0J52_13672 [Blattella germanica]